MDADDKRAVATVVVLLVIVVGSLYAGYVHHTTEGPRKTAEYNSPGWSCSKVYENPWGGFEPGKYWYRCTKEAD